MENVLLALLIAVGGALFVYALFKKLRGRRVERIAALILMIVVFMIFFLAGLNSVSSWTPLRDFQVALSTADPVAFWIEIAIFVVLAISGFSLGNGFLQFSRAQNERVKELDMSLANKRFLQGALTFLDAYFVVVVVIFGARVLLDVFGVIYAEPVLASLLDAITIWPFMWEIVGSVLFTAKFWRNKKVNLDFSLRIAPDLTAPDKVFLHRVFLVFFILIALWVLLLVDFLSPFFPAATMFGIFVIVGFFTSPVKEIIY